MKCPHCDCNHPDGTKFCPNTGKKIELLACQNHECPEYGKQQYPLNAKYCPKCGYNLQKQTDASVFMSFHNITLGETNIYDIDADEYQKSNDSIFGDIKVICVEDVDFEGNTITCFARQSDRKIFSLSFESSSDIDFPESWISAGLDADDLMVSMERLLCKQDFQWLEFEDEYGDTFGFAYKEIDSDLFLVFSIQDDKMMVSLLTEAMKDSLLRKYEEYGNDDEDCDRKDNLGNEIQAYFELSDFGVIISLSSRECVESLGGELLYVLNGGKLEEYEIADGTRCFFEVGKEGLCGVSFNENSLLPNILISVGINWGIPYNKAKEIFVNLGFEVEDENEEYWQGFKACNYSNIYGKVCVTMGGLVDDEDGRVKIIQIWSDF